jgi:hypothetical protein
MRMHRALMLSSLLLLPAPARGQARPSLEDDVRAVVRRMFDGMRAADSTQVRSVMALGVRFASIDARATPPGISYEPVDGWLAGVSKSAKRWDERVFDVQVRVDGNMAQVWAPYTFYLDGKIRHCGVDAIELLLDGGGWKITQLSDTQRCEGCREVPAGAE